MYFPPFTPFSTSQTSPRPKKNTRTGGLISLDNCPHVFRDKKCGTFLQWSKMVHTILSPAGMRQDTGRRRLKRYAQVFLRPMQLNFHQKPQIQTDCVKPLRRSLSGCGPSKTGGQKSTRPSFERPTLKTIRWTPDHRYVVLTLQLRSTTVVAGRVWRVGATVVVYTTVQHVYFCQVEDNTPHWIPKLFKISLALGREECKRRALRALLVKEKIARKLIPGSVIFYYLDYSIPYK